MEPDCGALIATALAGRQSRDRPDGRPWAAVEEELSRLPDRCGPTLLAHARRLIDELPATDEGELAVVLSAAGRRGATDVLKTLLQDAIRSPHTVLKEDYADILDDVFDRIDAVEPLDQLLHQPDRPDLVRVLETLSSLRAETSAPAARRYLNNDDRVLRSTAIGFVYNYDTPEAAPFFLRQLRAETDPDLVETLVDGLVMWGHTEAVPELKKLAASTADPAVRDVLLHAVHDLDGE